MLGSPFQRYRALIQSWFGTRFQAAISQDVHPCRRSPAAIIPQPLAADASASQATTECATARLSTSCFTTTQGASVAASIPSSSSTPAAKPSAISSSSSIPATECSTISSFAGLDRRHSIEHPVSCGKELWSARNFGGTCARSRRHQRQWQTMAAMQGWKVFDLWRPLRHFVNLSWASRCLSRWPRRLAERRRLGIRFEFRLATCQLCILC